MNMVVALLAAVSLLVAIREWNDSFPRRGPNGTLLPEVATATDTILVVISLVAIVAITVKYWLEAIWVNYKNPIEFTKVIIQKQVEMGMIDPDDLTENFNVSDNTWKYVFTKPSFYIESLLFVITNMPIQNPNSIFGRFIFYIPCVNWVDNSGNFNGSAHIYQTPYQSGDVFLSLMFLRFYFVAQAALVCAPINRTLHSKRVCYDNGLEPGLTY